MGGPDFIGPPDIRAAHVRIIERSRGKPWKSGCPRLLEYALRDPFYARLIWMEARHPTRREPIASKPNPHKPRPQQATGPDRKRLAANDRDD